MQGNLAQWTGIAVTSIVVLGSDIDVVYAVPLGIFAGALATFFATVANAQLEKKKPARRAGKPVPSKRYS